MINFYTWLGFCEKAFPIRILHVLYISRMLWRLNENVQNINDHNDQKRRMRWGDLSSD